MPVLECRWSQHRPSAFASVLETLSKCFNEASTYIWGVSRGLLFQDQDFRTGMQVWPYYLHFPTLMLNLLLSWEVDDETVGSTVDNKDLENDGQEWEQSKQPSAQDPKRSIDGNTGTKGLDVAEEKVYRKRNCVYSQLSQCMY